MKGTARVLLAGLALGTAGAQAGRPLVTNDAVLLDAKACQLESWVQRNRDSTELWMLPACNPLGFFELALGGARVHENGEHAFAQQQVELKTVFKPIAANGWGLGAVLGAVRHRRREVAPGWPGDGYFTVLASKSFLDDAWIAHLNAGAVRQRDERRTTATWGFAHEVTLRDDFQLLAELFRSEPGRPFYQLGLRYVLVPNRLILDATYGNRAVSDAAQRWFSIGFRLQSPPWFP